MSSYHIPVLLQPACAYLKITPGELYIDATFGGGSHTKEILRQGGKVLAIDQDSEALTNVPSHPHLHTVLGNFAEIKTISRQNNWTPISGILFDLGVSSHQLVSPERGFSYQAEGPLDMRMDLKASHKAADLINTLGTSQISHILIDYGEFSDPALIVKKIMQFRPITTTTQLANLFPNRKTVSRIFQAFRIAVNDELGAIKSALPQSLEILKPQGRLVVISFHSLEDRIVKTMFTSWEDQHLGKILTNKPVTPSLAEIASNSASHSAKLRVFEKI